jgi:aspartate carbamoyltransferase catalytic subunit
MIQRDYRKMFDELNRKNEEFEKILANMKGSDELSTKNLVSMDDLSEKDIELIFRMTLPFKELFIKRKEKKIPLLKGRSTINFFFEPSSRTRVSFELAGKHLGADTVNVGKSDTTIGVKGESLNDVARTLNRMYSDLIILRYGKSGTPQMIAKEITAPVISAGDGWHEHPTQVLGDLYTLYEKKGKIKGLTIVIVGDVLHSRVAGSLLRAFKKMGANVRIAAPSTLIPYGVEQLFGAKVYHKVEDALPGADAIYALRIQLERAAAAFIPSLREYSKMYVVNPKRLALAKPDAIVMHAGPFNRDLDVHSDVIEGPQSVIEEQVTNCFAVRFAVLTLLMLGKPGGKK